MSRRHETPKHQKPGMLSLGECERHHRHGAFGCLCVDYSFYPTGIGISSRSALRGVRHFGG